MRATEQTVDPRTERALIRTIAGASRKLDEDLNLSKLQAIDRLQKLDTKFRPLWWKHPFLVLADNYTIPANMPVPKMLAEIAAHGEPVGIVGVAVLSTQRWSVFKQMFRADEKSRKAVENSATITAELYKDTSRPAIGGNVYTNGKLASIFYSWEQRTPEHGFERAGEFDLVQNDSGKFELQIRKSAKWAKLMDDLRQHFEPVMDKVAERLSSTETKDFLVGMKKEK